MMWLLLFAGLFAVHLAGLLPAPGAATAAKVIGVVLFGVGLILAIVGVA